MAKLVLLLALATLLSAALAQRLSHGLNERLMRRARDAQTFRGGSGNNRRYGGYDGLDARAMRRARHAQNPSAGLTEDRPERGSLHVERLLQQAGFAAESGRVKRDAPDWMRERSGMHPYSGSHDRNWVRPQFGGNEDDMLGNMPRVPSMSRHMMERLRAELRRHRGSSRWGQGHRGRQGRHRYLPDMRAAYDAIRQSQRTGMPVRPHLDPRIDLMGQGQGQDEHDFRGEGGFSGGMGMAHHGMRMQHEDEDVRRHVMGHRRGYHSAGPRYTVI